MTPPSLHMVTVKKQASVEESISKTGYDFVPAKSASAQEAEVPNY